MMSGKIFFMGKILDVSIIILNYNSGNCLLDCLNSLKRQSFPIEKFEILVGDNSSNDDSFIKAQKFFLKEDDPLATKFIPLDKNFGFAQGNNLLAKQATAKNLLFLNPDTIVDQKWLELLILGSKRYQNSIIGPKIKFLKDPNNIQSLGLGITPSGQGFDIGFAEADNQIPDAFRLGVSGASLFIPQKIFTELGGFDPEFFCYYEDLDLGHRAWLAGYRVVNIPKSIVYHQYGKVWGTRNSPQRVYLSTRNRLLYISKNLELWNLLKSIFIGIIQDLGLLFYYGFSSTIKLALAIIRAYLYLLKNSPNVYKKRRSIQKNRNISDQFYKNFKISFRETWQEFRKITSS